METKFDARQLLDKILDGPKEPPPIVISVADPLLMPKLEQSTRKYRMRLNDAEVKVLIESLAVYELFLDQVDKRVESIGNNIFFLRDMLPVTRRTMEYHKTKDIMHVKSVLGHENIQSTMTILTLNRPCLPRKTMSPTSKL